jgi:GNAT superfamily N-acetyltransferase
MIRKATAADCQALARLHALGLPTSLLSALGHDGLVRYYTFALASKHEHVFVADVDGVVGGCVLSDEPHTLFERFARHAPLKFTRELAVQLVRNPNVRRRVAHRFAHPPSPAAGPYAPEVTQIFTEEAARGRGIGAQLLRACEDNLRERGVHAYFVHTHRDDNAAGIAFYRREGFVTISEGTSFGDVFLLMQKQLDG